MAPFKFRTVTHTLLVLFVPKFHLERVCTGVCQTHRKKYHKNLELNQTEGKVVPPPPFLPNQNPEVKTHDCKVQAMNHVWGAHVNALSGYVFGFCVWVIAWVQGYEYTCGCMCEGRCGCMHWCMFGSACVGAWGYWTVTNFWDSLSVLPSFRSMKTDKPLMNTAFTECRGSWRHFSLPPRLFTQ